MGPVAIGFLIESAVRRALSEIRGEAREAGLKRLRRELSSMGLPATMMVASSAVYDGARARIYAGRFAGAWTRATGGEYSEDAIEHATALTDARLEALGATEAAEAWNAARFAARLEGQFFRVWDAVNDERTCQYCRDADGTVVGLNEPFPQGEPGGVHPRCACTWSLLSPEESR